MSSYREIAVYIEGGICQDVLVVNKRKPFTEWEQEEYVLIDFDIEGTDISQICTGCMYSSTPHADSCGRVKVVNGRQVKR